MTSRSWGMVLGVAGVVLMIIGDAGQSGSGSKSGLLGGGLALGVGGVLLIAGVITLLVGLAWRTGAK